jgi:AcrR family transcriptional regulator
VSANRPFRREPSDTAGDVDLDEDLEEFLEAWDEADRDAAAVLCGALDRLRGEPAPSDALAAVAARIRDGLREGDHPFRWIRKAAALESEAFPEGDVELVLRCAAATISPQEETGLDPDEEAILLSLEHADWLGAIVSLVREGPGVDASPDALVAGIRACPEVELKSDLDLDDEAHLETGFWILALPWHVLGLTDRDQRLTAVGAWILPRALARAWGSDFDTGVER